MKFIKALYFSTLLSSCAAGAFAQNASNNLFTHTVTPGQSLYSIASMYNVSVEEIVDLNPGSEIILRSGSTLRIPQKKVVGDKNVFHTIQQGETLYKLTQKYGISATVICDANPGLSADNFKIGQVIVIPSANGQPSDSVAPKATPVNVVPKSDKQKSDKKYRELHKVERKETIYSISKQYNITEQALIDANPELKDGNLKKGSFLVIPNVVKVSEIAPTDVELFTKSRATSKKFTKVKAALLLPFMTKGGINDEQSKMVEYYEGFLLAVDSLKRQGYSFDIYTYDTDNDVESVKRVLAKSEMKDMNIIFGPAYYDQVKVASDFAKTNNIRLVIPFTSKGNDVYANPSVYQINTPQSYLYSEVYDHFLKQFPNSNVIFLNSGAGSSDKADFISGLKSELRNNNIKYSEVSGDAIIPESLITIMDPAKDNIFIPTSSKNAALIKLLPQLVVTARTNPEFTVKLFGYPEWQTYTNDHLNNFYELDTYFYTSFYTNNLFPEAVNFSTLFRRTYGKIMANSYPKYGMLGFDTAYFFLKALSQYGNETEANISKVKFTPIQTSFKFERVNNWGGFINKKVFFVHLTKNYELIKMHFE